MSAASREPAQEPELDHYSRLVTRARALSAVSSLPTEALFRIHALLEVLLGADEFGERERAALAELEHTLDAAGGSGQT